MLEVVEQLLEEPGMCGIADAFVPDQHLCLVRHLRPREVPERDLVLAPAVRLDLDERTALQGHVVGEGDDGLVTAPRGDVHVVLDLLRLQRVAVGLGLHERGPELPGPLRPDDPVRALRAVAVGERYLGERLHPAGGSPETSGEASTELRHFRHDGEQDRCRAHLPLPVALVGGDGEEPGGLPRIVLRQRLLRGLRESDLLLGRARSAAAGGLGRVRGRGRGGGRPARGRYRAIRG